MAKVTRSAHFNIKPQGHLINILEATRDHHPNFVLFLGAGASVTSNVDAVSKMLERWRSQHYQMYGSGKTQDEHFQAQLWYKRNDEYSILFEELYDQPSQRREYIECCLKKATPSWGYIYLVNLLRNGVFNAVFTTNFDDLLNEACYLFSSDVRPIVCAHDSSIRSVRITSKRPKIIKLHGDFLFDNIKNTVRELESLEDNMKEKFRQYASEFGFIFVGYSGNDRSVTESLNGLLRQESIFPHGVYWCVRKGAELSDNVQLLARFPRFHLVEIDGFDELFAEMHEAMKFELQPEMSDPYAALIRRLNSLVQDANVSATQPHPVILRHIKAIGDRINRQTSSKANDAPADPKGNGNSLLAPRIPYHMLSQIARREKKYEDALKYLILELDVNVTVVVLVDAFECMQQYAKLEYKEELMNRTRAAKAAIEARPGSTFDMALPLIKARQFAEAEEILKLGYAAHLKNPEVNFNESYYVLNLRQIKAHRQEAFLPEEIKELEGIAATGDELVKMAALILLNRWGEAEAYLIQAMAKRLAEPTSIFAWPIMDLLKPHLTRTPQQLEQDALGPPKITGPNIAAAKLAPKSEAAATRPTEN